MKLSYFKRFPPALAQLLPGSSRAAGSGKACSARRLQRLRYIHALNMHVCNIYPSSMGVRNIHALNMHVCNIYRCIKNDVYLFLLTGSFSGLATMQGAAGQWLARGFGYGAAYLGGQRCWGGEELVTTLMRGSLAAGLGCVFPPFHRFSCSHRDARCHGCCSEPIPCENLV